MYRLQRIHTIEIVSYCISAISGFIALLFGISYGFSAFTEVGLHNETALSMLQLALWGVFLAALIIGLILRAIEKDISEELKYIDSEMQKH